MAPSLLEIDSLEVLVINDNEVDPMSRYLHPGIQVSGQFRDVALASQFPAPTPGREDPRGGSAREIRMDGLCCGSHGLSLMITAVKGDTRKTVLFDTGPEEDGWERNVQRLKPDLSTIDAMQLSHWHRDHSGGMLRAVKMIAESKTENKNPCVLTVDLHPDRPDYRGFVVPGYDGIIEHVSLEADPTFEEIEAAGATVSRNKEPHTILDDMFLVSGEIPRVTEYEVGVRFGQRYSVAKGSWEMDELIMDERFLMCRVKDKGLVMFTGCSHAGVVNASQHAVTLGSSSATAAANNPDRRNKVPPLYAIVGGYHLADGDQTKTEITVRDLKSLDPQLLVPGHCSGWRVKYEIERVMPGRLAPLTVGNKFVF